MSLHTCICLYLFVPDSSAAIDSPSDQVLHSHTLPASMGQATAGHEEILL